MSCRNISFVRVCTAYRLWAPVLLVIVAAACGPQEPARGAGMAAGFHDAMHEGPGEVWALRWIIPVRWKANIGMAAGTGEVIHHAKSVAVVDGDTRDDTLRLCGVQHPAYALRSYLGSETYQAEYPDAAFDTEALPTVEMKTHLAQDGAFISDLVPLQLGGLLHDARRAAWPAIGAEFPGHLETNDDGTAGFTTRMRTEEPFFGPPVNMRRTRRAQTFNVAMRHLVGAAGAFVNETFAEGRVQVGGIGKKAALDMRVLACRLEDGSSCTAAELYDLNNFSPVYIVTGSGHFAMQRVVPGTGCAEIRAMAFKP